MRGLFTALAVALTVLTPTSSALADGVETAGDILQIVLPAAAFGATMAYDDWEGTRQFGKSFLATMVTTTALKYSIDARRPDGGGQSMPSGHTASAFAGAAFIQRRYGWRLGIPAYGAASFVAFSRVDSNKHHVEDVIVGAGLAIASAYLFTKPLPKGIRVTPLTRDGQWGLLFSGRW